MGFCRTISRDLYKEKEQKEKQFNGWIRTQLLPWVEKQTEFESRANYYDDIVGIIIKLNDLFFYVFY